MGYPWGQISLVGHWATRALEWKGEDGVTHNGYHIVVAAEQSSVPAATHTPTPTLIELG